MPDSATTADLLDRVSAGDASAEADLFGRHREPLRRMVAIRMDQSLQHRFDPSDVVQDALAEAHRRLPQFAADRPVAFYPWLRQIAWEKLVALHRRHAGASKRTVHREEPLVPRLPDESAVLLADRLAARTSSPSQEALRRELQDRIRLALADLSDNDREVIVLRHLEDLTFRETADVLGISESAVYSRYRRAVTHLHQKLSPYGQP
jgi:RNA polymerase sigma-70 factor (ECF subfamily)